MNSSNKDNSQETISVREIKKIFGIKNANTIKRYIKHGLLEVVSQNKFGRKKINKASLMKRLGINTLDEPFIGIIEAAKILGIESEALHSLAYRKKIQAYRFDYKKGMAYYFRVSELNSYIAKKVKKLAKENVAQEEDLHHPHEIKRRDESISKIIIELLKWDKDVARLNPRRIQVLEDYFIKNKKKTSIAKEVNLSIGAVTQIIYRTLERLPFYIQENRKSWVAMFSTLQDLRPEVINLREENDVLRRKLNIKERENLLGSSDLLQPLKAFDFSVRALNVFKNAELQTLEDLISISRSDLLKYRNVGIKTIQEIEAFLIQRGLSFNSTGRFLRTPPSGLREDHARISDPNSDFNQLLQKCLKTPPKIVNKRKKAKVINNFPSVAQYPKVSIPNDTDARSYDTDYAIERNIPIPEKKKNGISQKIINTMLQMQVKDSFSIQYEDKLEFFRMRNRLSAAIGRIKKTHDKQLRFTVGNYADENLLRVWRIS